MKRFIFAMTLVAALCFSLTLGAQTRSTIDGQFGRITITSSSTLAPQGKNSYAPGNVMDGNDRTAWVEGASGNGVGQWIKVGFDSPAKISSIYFKNGYGKSASAFKKNARVRDIEISTQSGSYVRTVPDQRAEMKILLPRKLADKKTKWVKLTIKSIYPGTKYKDTAITEFVPDLEEHNYE
jgi:hypothetical protein